MAVAMEAFDGGLLDRAVHSLDLAAPRESGPPDCILIHAAPGMVGLGLQVFDPASQIMSTRMGPE